MDEEEWIDNRDNASFDDSEQFEDDLSFASDSADCQCAKCSRQEFVSWRLERSSSPRSLNAEDTFDDASPHVWAAQCSLPPDPYHRRSRRSAASDATLTPNNSASSSSRCRGALTPRGYNTVEPQRLLLIAARSCARYLTFAEVEAFYRHKLASVAESELAEQLAALQPCSSTSTAPPVRRGIVAPSMFPGGRRTGDSVPEEYFKPIIMFCFPKDAEEIQMYSCLANGNMTPFTNGMEHYRRGGVSNVIQIGYLLSGRVKPQQTSLPPASCENRADPVYMVSLKVDRCRIVQCECSCGAAKMWCEHVVALCLYRMYNKEKIEYRITIWDAINDLEGAQLKKFAQYFITALPRKYLHTAQNLIDALRDANSDITKSIGAPDPTDSGHDSLALWCFDQSQLHARIEKALIKFCLPRLNEVHCDVQMLSSTSPAISSEWMQLLKTFRDKSPEPLWNLLSMLRGMFARRDENAITLLHILTDELLASKQILMLWLVTRLQQSGEWVHARDKKLFPPVTHLEKTQLHAAALCDEMVALWRLAALNPLLSKKHRQQLAAQLQLYHHCAVQRVWEIVHSFHAGKESEGRPHTARRLAAPTDYYSMTCLFLQCTLNASRESLSTATLRFTVQQFPGFFPALQACQLDWCSDRSLSGNVHSSPALYPRTKQLKRPYSTPAAPPSSFEYGYDTVDLTLDDSYKKKKKNKKKASKGKRDQSSAHGGSSSQSSRPRSLYARQHNQPSSSSHRVEEADSAESGQESDMPSTSAAATPLTTRAPSFPAEDVDLLFAAAHEPLNGMDGKLARCEGLFAHGYVEEAVGRVSVLIEAMRMNLPRLVWKADKKELAREEDEMAQAFMHAAAATTNKNTGASSKSGFPRGGGQGGGGRFGVVRHTLSSTRPTHSSPFHSSPYKAPAPNTPFPFFPNGTVHDMSLATCRTLERAVLVAKMMEGCWVKQSALFNLLIDVLALPRAAMSTSYLQVKLYTMENEILTILKRMRLGRADLETLRTRAIQLLKWNDHAAMTERGVPPVYLASFIFSVLVGTEGELRKADDEKLALSACLSVLGGRHPYPDIVYPMLGEYLRRQKGDMAMVLLTRYKDNTQKLGLVMDRLLDTTQHRMYKYHKTNAVTFLERDAVYGSVMEKGERPGLPIYPEATCRGRGETEKKEEEEERARQLHELNDSDAGGAASEESCRRASMGQQSVDASSSSVESGDCNEEGEEGGAPAAISACTHRDAHDDGSGAFTCCARRSSECASSSSIASSSSRAAPSPPSSSHSKSGSSASLAMLQPPRYIKRSRVPVPCEAHAHYMAELAKKLNTEAGGDQTSILFNAQQQATHRKLQMCAFLTGLYALGLSNDTSRSWASRTYSTTVFWLQSLALDIGAQALEVVRETWPAHFTPSEAASLADKASASRDASIVSAGALLALSVLSSSHALSDAEGKGALRQCKDMSVDMLNQAITAVEEAANREEVSPDILFACARVWADVQLDTDPPPSKPLPFQPRAVPVSGAGGGNGARAAGAGGVQYLQYGQPEYAHNVATPPPPYMVGVQQPPYGVYVPQVQPSHGYGSHGMGGGGGVHGVPAHFLLPPPPLPPVPCMHQPPPSMGAMAQRGDDGSDTPSSSASSSSGNAGRSSMHTSHSAPNLTPALQQQQMAASGAGASTSSVVLPPIPLHHIVQAQQRPVVSHDARLERLDRAQRIGLKAMEAVAKRQADDRSFHKYSQDASYEDDVMWLFRTSFSMGPYFVGHFCEVAANTISSPFVLANLVTILCKWNAQTGYRHMTTAQKMTGHGQGRFRQAAIMGGMQTPVAELFDRCIEQSLTAIITRLTAIQRLGQQEMEDICVVFSRMRDTMSLIPSGWEHMEWTYKFITSRIKMKSLKPHMAMKDLTTRLNDIHQGGCERMGQPPPSVGGAGVMMLHPPHNMPSWSGR